MQQTREILSDEELYALTVGLPWEWEYVGGRIIMSPPTNPDTGNLNAEIIAAFVVWARAYHYAPFDSSTGFRLPSGNLRSPDAALIRRARWDAATPGERKRIVPDVVLELRSGRDARAPLEEKCAEWHAGGVAFVLFADPYEAPTLTTWGIAPHAALAALGEQVITLCVQAQSSPPARGE